MSQSHQRTVSDQFSVSSKHVQWFRDGPLLRTWDSLNCFRAPSCLPSDGVQSGNPASVPDIRSQFNSFHKSLIIWQGRDSNPRPGIIGTGASPYPSLSRWCTSRRAPRSPRRAVPRAPSPSADLEGQASPDRCAVRFGKVPAWSQCSRRLFGMGELSIPVLITPALAATGSILLAARSYWHRTSTPRTTLLEEAAPL